MTRAISLLVFFGIVASAASLRDDGIAAFHSGHYGQALDLLQRAVAADANDSQSSAFLALTQSARNDCRSALPALLRFSEGADAALARLTGIAASKCQVFEGDEASAFTTLHKLVVRFPNDPDVLYTVAKFHMKEFNDTTFAMFQHAASSFRVHQLSAEILEVQGKYEEAVSEYRKAIAANPQGAALHFRLGRALLMAAHGPEALAQARAEFEAELTISPEDSAAEFQVAQIAQAEGEKETSLQHVQRALQLSPDFPEALLLLAKLKLQSKSYNEAIELLKKAVKLQPANEGAHYTLMVAYRDAGQMQNAKEEKAELDRLRKPPEGEFTDFLKKLGEQAPQQ